MQLALSILEASKSSGIGRTKLYECINSGELKAKKLGKRTVIMTTDLSDFCRAWTLIQRPILIKTKKNPTMGMAGCSCVCKTRILICHSLFNLESEKTND